MVYILPFHSGISPPPKSDKGNHFIAALRFEKNLCPLEKSDKGFFSRSILHGLHQNSREDTISCPPCL